MDHKRDSDRNSVAGINQMRSIINEKTSSWAMTNEIARYTVASKLDNRDGRPPASAQVHSEEVKEVGKGFESPHRNQGSGKYCRVESD